MNKRFVFSLICIVILTVSFIHAQSTNGKSEPTGRENWFPNRGNVGIGTRTPSDELEVLGNIRVSQTIFTNNLETIGLKTVNLSVSQDASVGRNLFVQGNVGIGVPNPTERLEIQGNLKVSNDIFADRITTRQFSATDGDVSHSLVVGQKFIVNGLTGLGVSSPVERLEVAGNLKATEKLISDQLNTGDGLFSRNLEVTQNLVVNGNTGLGVSMPNERFEVAGSARISQGLFSATLNSGDGMFTGTVRSNQNFIADGLIGIGTATPSEKLDVIGNARISQGLFSASLNSGDGLFTGTVRSNQNFVADGLIGIGTTTPSEKLDVMGNARVSQGLFSASLNSGDGLFTGTVRSNQNFIADGSVGIGTTAPSEKLDVIGNIKSSGDVLSVNVKADKGYFNTLESNGNLIINGNVGIGVPNPIEKLEVAGNIKSAQMLMSDQLNTGDGLFSRNVRINQNLVIDGNIGLGVSVPTERFEIAGNAKVSQGLFSATLNSGEGLFTGSVRSNQNFIADGSIGIGTAAPTEKLDVNGNIKSSGNVTSVNVRADKGYFTSLESNGNLTINGNVGIGVSNPSEKLEVAGNIKATQRVLANSAQITQGLSVGQNATISGNVGIGITPGTERLSVAGDAYVNGLLTAENLTVKQKLDLRGAFTVAGTLGVGVSNPEAALHVNGDGKFDGDIRANKIIVNAIEIAGATPTPGGDGSSVSLGDNLMVNGSVGIGTTKISGYKLSVNGKIRASDDIKVYLESEWSDFVFDKNYNLRPLGEVEKYIKENGHLPEMPSAEVVKKEGIDLGAMDAKLLQKIEELTLYVLEMKKENELLRKEIDSIKSSVKK